MTRSQANEAIEVIKNDCTAQARYIAIDDEGESCNCVIGGLAQAAGIDLSPLLNDWATNNASVYPVCGTQRSKYTIDFLHNMIAAIKEKFGLTENQIWRLQETNDSYENMDLGTRRNVLIQQVETYVL